MLFFRFILEENESNPEITLVENTGSLGMSKVI